MANATAQAIGDHQRCSTNLQAPQFEIIFYSHIIWASRQGNINKPQHFLSITRITLTYLEKISYSVYT